MGFKAAFKKDVVEAMYHKTDLGEESVSLYSISGTSSTEDAFVKPFQRKERDSMKNSNSLNEDSDTTMKKAKHSFTSQRVSEGQASVASHPSCSCEPPCSCEAQEFKGFAGPDKMEVHCLLFLDVRPDHPDVGSLFVALQTGTVQLWSHNPKGGFIDSFYAVHIIGDYVTTMATDEDNDFLFTGTRFGYVKIWHIVNYCVLPEMVVHRCVPALRLEFPFLMNDKILGRAKRAVRGQEEPFLCSSSRNHLDRVMHIELLDKQKIYITCGLDRTVRLWTFSGTYIGVLGGVNHWKPIDENEVAPVHTSESRIPADLTRVLSSTSFKVLTARAHTTSKWSSPATMDTELETDELFEYRFNEFEEVFHGICNFPEENKDYELKSPEASEGEIIQKNMKEPVLRVLNMLKTVGQYDMNPPKGDRLARNIKQLLEDTDRRWVKGRPTPPGQPTRTRPKERWVERLPSHQKFWRKATIQDQEAVQTVLPQKSETSVKTTSSGVSSKTRPWWLSPDVKDLEGLLRAYEESAKGWYKQQM